MDRQPLTDRLGDKLLAEYGGAAAAYSLRALSGDQTKVVRVRRSSDNAEKDFTASEMGAALEDWVGALNDGYVETWYDQSGNGNDATQTVTANQPKIVDAGTYLGELDFDGVNDGLFTASNLTDTFQSVTIFAVTQDDTTTGRASMVRCRPNGLIGTLTGFIWEKNASNTYGGNTLLEGANGAVASSPNGQGTRNTSENLNTLVYQQSQVLAYENGTLDETLSTVRAGSVPVGDVTLVDQLWIGQNFDDNARPFDGSMKEIVVYLTDQSANRTAIEANINNQYSLY